MTEKRFRFTKSAVDGVANPTEAEVGTVGYRIVWDTQVIGFGLQLRHLDVEPAIVAETCALRHLVLPWSDDEMNRCDIRMRQETTHEIECMALNAGDLR
jgi:hypothetical protein